jgi:hypothetical protein
MQRRRPPLSVCVCVYRLRRKRPKHATGSARSSARKRTTTTPLSPTSLSQHRRRPQRPMCGQTLRCTSRRGSARWQQSRGWFPSRRLPRRRRRCRPTGRTLRLLRFRRCCRPTAKMRPAVRLCTMRSAPVTFACPNCCWSAAGSGTAAASSPPKSCRSRTSSALSMDSRSVHADSTAAQQHSTRILLSHRMLLSGFVSVCLSRTARVGRIATEEGRRRR